MKVLLFYLYAGFLSFMCAEVFAGSLPNWIISSWAWLVTYPLYMAHFLFFSSLARLTKRTSLGSLYLWGVLFGLYESWVTKVTWAGYPGSDGYAFGSLFGFGIHETLGLILFYHSVVSFLVPLMVLSLISPSVREEFSLPNRLFENTKMKRVFLFGLIIMFAAMSSYNLPEIKDIVLTWLPSIVLSVVGYKFLSKQENLKDRFTLSFSVRSTALLGAFILFIYVATYFLILPERIPEGFVMQFSTLLIYGVILFLLYKKEKGVVPKQNFDILPKVVFRSFLAIYVLCLLFGAVKILYPEAMVVVLIPVFALFIPIGVALFFILGVPRKA